MRRFYQFRGWYFVLTRQYDQAKELLDRAENEFNHITDLEGGWDDLSRLHTYSLLGECMVHEGNFEQAEK